MFLDFVLNADLTHEVKQYGKDSWNYNFLSTIDTLKFYYHLPLIVSNHTFSLSFQTRSYERTENFSCGGVIDT